MLGRIRILHCNIISRVKPIPQTSFSISILLRVPVTNKMIIGLLQAVLQIDKLKIPAAPCND